MYWCRNILRRAVPATPARIAVFCALLALASLRCISDFLVAPGGASAAPLRLAFVAAPRAGIAGAPIPTVRVAVFDRSGATDTAVATHVTLRLVGGPPGATLGGTRRARVEDGAAEFRDLTVDSAGSFRLAAEPDSAGIVPDTSAPFALAWPEVRRLELEPGELEFAAIGDTVTITVEARADGGRLVPTPPLAWASSNPAVAAVDARSLVEARGDGRADVTARIGGVAATVAVTVEQRAASVTLSPGDFALPLSASAQLVATVVDANGHPLAAPRLSWRSSRSRTVAVYPSEDSRTALVRRYRTGTATITATTEGISGTATVR